MPLAFSKAMTWAAWAVTATIGLALVAAAVGMLLPVSHSATVERVVAGPPGEVWAVMTDVGSFPTWRTDVERVTRLPDRDGLPVWREESPAGAMTLEVTALDTGRRMVTRIADEGLPFGGTWTYRLQADADGTLVTIAEDGEIYNPVFRFMARFVLGYEGTLNTYLDALEARMSGQSG